MAGTGHELDAQALDVVVRVAQGMDLQLAAIAGAGVDLADGQGLAEDGQQLALDALGLDGQRSLAPGGASVAMPPRAICLTIFHMVVWVRMGMGSQVVPRVAQVERLVDQGKVGNDVADHRVFEHRPVLPRRIVAVAAPHPRLAALPSSSSATSTSPRQPSTQPAPRAATGGSCSPVRTGPPAGRPRWRGSGARIRRPRRSGPRPGPRHRRRHGSPPSRPARHREARAGRSAGRALAAGPGRQAGESQPGRQLG